jgi:succinoglycan biosynthesis transport protein ExoP
MRELLYFLRYLSRYKLTLAIVPVITVVACFFLVRELPDEFKSQGRIATGLVDKTDQIILNGEDDQEAEIGRKFDNLIQLMRLNKTIDQVSYKLILHDLTAHPVIKSLLPF